MDTIKRSLAFAALVMAALILAGCGDHPQSAGTKVVYQTVYKETQRPCPVTKPERPAPLARPLPADPGALVDVLTAKLEEWAGKGKYGDRADAAIDTCLKPDPPG